MGAGSEAGDGRADENRGRLDAELGGPALGFGEGFS
jgi:hypothetical protein